MAISAKRAACIVRRKSAATIVIAAMVFAGLAYAYPAQKAFAHNFSQTETTEFLAATWMTKTYLELAQVSVHDDPGLAKMYAQTATTFLNEKWMGEIKERNQRVGTDLSASLAQLPVSIEEGQSAAQIKEQVHGIKSLIAEAVSVRIDRVELASSTTQSLVMAKVLSESLLQYQVSQGVEEGLAYELAYGIKKMSEMGNLTSTMEPGAMKMAQYNAAKALVSKAFYISTKIKKSDATDPALVDTAKMSLRQVKSGIEDKMPWMQVITTMHQKVHENLRMGFNLQMQMQM